MMKYDYERFTDTDTVWDTNSIENQSYWKHLDNEILRKICFHICFKLQFKKQTCMIIKKEVLRIWESRIYFSFKDSV